MSGAEKTNVTKPAPWFAVRILSADPLVTFSTAELNRFPILELAHAVPELFDKPRGLHFLNFTHSIEVWRGPEFVASELAKAQAQLPGHQFALMTASEYESWLLAQRSIPSLLGNGLILTDERVWRPMPPMIPGLKIYDAIYNARLAPSKRHELAAKIGSLLLVYPHALSHSDDEAYERVKESLPHAMFANHQLGQGKYTKFGPENMVKLLGHARVGLALTAVEGSMRASMEYMLAGLPVVSTRSVGGRDRYLHSNYCRIVADDPEDVARAVRELCELNLDRRRIRLHVAELLAFDRHNFLLNANKLAKAVFGRDNLLPTFDPLMGAVAEFYPLDRIAASLREQFGSAGPAKAETGISG